MATIMKKQKRALSVNGEPATNRITAALNAAPIMSDRQMVEIRPPNFKTVRFELVGIDPLVVHRYGQKAQKAWEGIVTRRPEDVKGKKRERAPRDFESDYNESRHLSTEGWDGINAMAIKNAMVSICVIKDFFKSRAKLVLFVKADGFAKDGMPLVKISKGKPRLFTTMAQNTSGGRDLRTRAWFDAGWEAVVTIEYDADVLTLDSVTNLLNSAGLQCGICEGRPNSKLSAGCGWGRFKIKGT